MGDIKGWFTMNGMHIPIIEGQSKAEAASKYINSKHGKTVAELTSKTKSTNKSKLDKYRNMTDNDLDKLNEEISQMSSNELYSKGLNGDSYTQKLIYKLGLNDKPTVLSKEEFDKKAKDQELLYRGCRGKADMTASDFHNTIKNGDFTFISNGAYGGGLYFTTSQSEATNYYSDKSKGSIMTAYINKHRAKIVDYDKISDKYLKLSDTDKGFKERFKSISSFALYNGYNVIKKSFSDATYYVAITRDVLVISDEDK